MEAISVTSGAPALAIIVSNEHIIINIIEFIIIIEFIFKTIG